MSPEIRGQTGEGGEFGTWDAYPLWVQEAGRLADRRQITNNLFLSINSVLVGGVAVLAQQTVQAPHLQISVTLVILEVILASVGFLLSHQWLRLLQLYSRLLNFRYEKLEALERQPGFPGAIFPSDAGNVGMYTLESKEGKARAIFGFGKHEEFIPKLFRVLYVVATVLLVLGLVAIRVHFAAWLGEHISIPVMR